MKKIKTAIIGLGNIGIEYDLKLNKKDFILTHTNAINSHRSYKLVAGLDKNLSQCKKLQKYYNVSAYTSIDKMFANHEIDLAVLSVNSHYLYSTCEKILKQKKIKSIICEKPFSTDIKSGKKLLKISKQKDINIIVNYFRRFHPNLINLKKKIISHKYGECNKCIVEYSKGINAYASHFIDLLVYFFGQVIKVEKIGSFRKINNDSVGDFVITFKNNFKAHFIYMGTNECLINNIRMSFDKCLIELPNGGENVMISEYTKNKIFKNEKNIDKLDIHSKLNFDKYMFYVFDYLKSKINKREGNFISSAKDALETVGAIEKLLK